MARLEDRTDASPEDEGEELWERLLEGERPDGSTAKALRLAHEAVGRFPELAGRYKKHVGAAVVVSSVVTLLAGIAIARRMKKGERPEEIVATITQEEIEKAATVAQRQQRWRRMLRRLRQRAAEQEPPAGQ